MTQGGMEGKLLIKEGSRPSPRGDEERGREEGIYRGTHF